MRPVPRTAQYVLTASQITELLNLPDDQTIIRMAVDPVMNLLQVVVQSDRLRELEEPDNEPYIIRLPGRIS